MLESAQETEVAVDTQNEVEQPHASIEPGALTVSVDDFSALEDRIRRAVDLVKGERQARIAAEERAAQAESRATQAETQLQEQSPLLEQLQNEMNTLRTEREQVRQRVERLLAQLDALEL